MAPPLQRIVWLYKRWQPLYDVIRKTVFPPVEFRRGIPMDLDGDYFFDPRMRNVIILDDLVSIAVKDPKINDLFTEVVGSIPGRVIPKTLKFVVVASPPNARHIYR
jgi:hypothetical protein